MNNTKKNNFYKQKPRQLAGFKRSSPSEELEHLLGIQPLNAWEKNSLKEIPNLFLVSPAAEPGNR